MAYSRVQSFYSWMIGIVERKENLLEDSVCVVRNIVCHLERGRERDIMRKRKRKRKSYNEKEEEEEKEI